MSAKAGSEIPITLEDLAKVAKFSTQLLLAVKYVPARNVQEMRAELGPQEKRPTGWSDVRGASAGKTSQSMSVLDVAGKVNGGDDLMNEDINAALNTVRTGLQIGLHLGVLYARFSGLDSLKERQQRNQLGSDEARWSALMETHSAITLFVAAYYVTWKLAGHKQDELSKINANFVGLPEPLSLGNGQTRALNGLLFHYGSYLQSAQTALEVLKVTQLYFKAVLDELKDRVQSLQHAEAFTQNSYRLVDTTFTVNGFHGEIHGSAGVALQFKRVDLGNVVGNHEAKRLAYRLAQYLMAYDVKEQANPMVEFGAFPWTCMYMGKPGTGKTMILTGTVTLASDYCKALGVPFRYHPMPNTMVSTFQGGSAEAMQSWMNPLKNPNEIIVAPIDDAENMFESRTRQGTSEGVRGIINTFLVNTEGSSAVIRGNALLCFATNLPDQVDAAVMNRIQARARVEGAETREDFVDQFYLWAGQIGKMNAGIVDLKEPNGYQFLSAQGIRPQFERKLEQLALFKDKRLTALHERLASEGYGHNQYDYMGHFFARLIKEFPAFSSRDVRNIQTAVMARFFDFDFPKEWLEARANFVEKPYGEKRAMILEVAQGNMGRLKFSDVLFQELVLYLDTTVGILEGGFARRVEELVENAKVHRRAEAVLTAKA